VEIRQREKEAMNEQSPGPTSFPALREILSGREPPPVAFVARRAAYPWLVVGTVSIGAFMGQLDASIVQLILPMLESDFAAKLDAVNWVALAYLLTMTVFLPVCGRLADMFGHKLLYTGGFLLFVLGSALCSMAPSLWLLIAFRVLEAIGASLLAANSIAIVVRATSPAQRGRALGIQGAAQAIGLAVGPALGGILLETLGWRSVFWINVPFGLAGVAAGWLILPQTTGLSEDKRFDWRGALLIGLALAALVIALNQAHAWGLSSALIGTALAAAVLLVLFVLTERRATPPLVDLNLFRSRAFASGNAAGLLVYAALFGMFFLMPFVFVRGYHDSWLLAGLRLSVIPVAIGITAPLSGALSDRLGPRVPNVAGTVTCLVSLGLLFVALDETGHHVALIVLALAVFGAGQGLFTAPNNSAVMTAAPRRLSGEAGSLLNVMRSLGMSIGIAAAAAILAWQLQELTGDGNTTVGVPPAELLAAARAVTVLLAGLCIAATALSLVRPKPAAN
jgi:EmrB/QacA subfamily drug resistance transporter